MNILNDREERILKILIDKYNGNAEMKVSGLYKEFPTDARLVVGDIFEKLKQYGYIGRYTQSFNVLIDFPIKYEDFAINKEFDDIREHMDKFCNYMLLMLTVDIPDYVPEKTTDKIYLFLNYDIIDYYKDIL